MSQDIKAIETTTDLSEPVKYSIVQWGASDGFEIMRRLTPVFAPALLAFKGIKSAGGLADIKDGNLIDIDLEKLFLGITGDVAEPISAALTAIAEAIMKEGDAELLREILVSTHRAYNNEAFEVGKKKDFDRAYQGNYGELLVAVTQTLAANYGGIFARFSSKKK